MVAGSADKISVADRARPSGVFSSRKLRVGIRRHSRPLAPCSGASCSFEMVDGTQCSQIWLACRFFSTVDYFCQGQGRWLGGQVSRHGRETNRALVGCISRGCMAVWLCFLLEWHSPCRAVCERPDTSRDSQYHGIENAGSKETLPFA